jgi:hypothetical protein
VFVAHVYHFIVAVVFQSGHVLEEDKREEKGEK